VIADCVNPVAASRTAWRAVAAAVAVAAVEIEIICSDNQRASAPRRDAQPRLPGLVPPTWAEIAAEIAAGGYEPWDRARIVVDTARSAVAETVRSLRERLGQR
jgi:hypothetical protein